MGTLGIPILERRRCAGLKPTDRPLHFFRSVKTASPPRRGLGKPESSHYPDRSKEDKSKKERYALTLRPGDPSRYSDYDDENPKHQQAFNHSLIPSISEL
jgi:hypothetical protein